MSDQRTMSTADSDTELLHRWTAGDANAGNELLARHFGRVRRFFASKVSPVDVEDLVQRTFAACVEAASRFRGQARFSTFLLSIARHQLHRHFRDRVRDDARVQPDLSISCVADLGVSPSSAVAGAQNETLVLRALQRVSVEQQTIVELHYWDGLAASEIAGVLGIEPGAVRTRLHRARAALRTQLQQLIGEGSGTTELDEAIRALGLRI